MFIVSAPVEKLKYLLESIHLNNELMLSYHHGYKSDVWLPELKQQRLLFSYSCSNSIWLLVVLLLATVECASHLTAIIKYKLN